MKEGRVRFMMAGMNLRGVVMGLCFVAFTAAPAGAQPILLYEKGKLDEMKGMRRVVVSAQNERDRAAIAKQINGRHGLRVVRNASAAQVIVYYVCGMPAQPPAMTHLTVNIPHSDRMVSVWSKKGTTENCRNPAARTSLVNEFLKDFAEMNGKKSDT